MRIFSSSWRDVGLCCVPSGALICNTGFSPLSIDSFSLRWTGWGAAHIELRPLNMFNQWLRSSQQNTSAEAAQPAHAPIPLQCIRGITVNVSHNIRRWREMYPKYRIWTLPTCFHRSQIGSLRKFFFHFDKHIHWSDWCARKSFTITERSKFKRSVRAASITPCCAQHLP